MRIYLSVPIIANRNPGRAETMRRAIEDSGNYVTSPWVLSQEEGKPGGSTNVFERDRAAVEASDAIVADVSKPSTGIGMEIMAAHYHEKRVVLVMEKGSIVSRMLLHMNPKEALEFSDDAGLYAGLRQLLTTGKNTVDRESV